MSDWHKERYAAGEALADVARDLLKEHERQVHPAMRDHHVKQVLVPRFTAALAEYERTKDAP